MDQRTWTACHVEAFDYFGGVPRRLVSDNLKTGVIKPDIYDPMLNRSYAELAAHYRCLIDPARALKPKDKPGSNDRCPTSETPCGADVSGSICPTCRRGALTWCTDVAGVRAHRSLDGASPLSVFEAVEAPALIALPSAPFELATWSYPKVGPDCYAKVGQGALHGAVALHRPPGRCPSRGAHRRVLRRRQGDQDLGPDREGQADRLGRLPAREGGLLHAHARSGACKRAGELGPHVKALVRGPARGRTPCYRLRQAQGVVAPGRKHGAERLDAACRRAIEIGDPEYRTVKGILIGRHRGRGDTRTASRLMPRPTSMAR